MNSKAPYSGTSGLNAVIILLVVIEALDSIMLGTSMPTVLANLGGIGWYGWTVGAFGLASFAAIPIFGGLIARWGLRNTLLLALGLFLLGSVGAALAPKMKLLVGGRVLQGLGMGGITVLPFAIISENFPKERRAKALGLMSPVWVVCGLVGPVLASQILELSSWPWIFWFNIPLILVVLALILRLLPKDGPAPSNPAKLNIAGPVLFSIAAGFSIKAFTSEWPVNLIQWAVAAVALLIFIVRESRHPNPFIPSDAWKIYKPLGAIFLAVILLRACFGAVRIYLPLLLQGMWGMGALAAGFSITLASIAWTGGDLLISRAGSIKTRSAKWGTLLLIVALLLILILLWVHGAVLWAYVFWACVGVGMGITSSVYNASTVKISEDYPRGVAGSTLQLGATFGGAAGAAAANTIAQWGFATGFNPKQLQAGALSGASLEALIQGVSLAKGLGMVFAALSLAAAWKFFRAKQS